MLFGWGSKPDLSELRTQMDAALKADVIPKLRAAGFRGSYPHFRRIRPDGTDLLTFQFRREGGAFVIEIARAPEGPHVTHWGKVIDAKNLTAWDINGDMRVRLTPAGIAGSDLWFHFSDGQIGLCVKQVERQLRAAEAWWALPPRLPR
jgi:hypothetical protein